MDGIVFVPPLGMPQPRSTLKQSSSRRRSNHASEPSRSAARRTKPDQPVIVPIVEEEIHVGKAQHKTGRVRVRVVPQERIETIDVPLVHEDVDVQRVPVNRVVDTPTPVRQEGDIMIVPVFEEVLIVEKKLVLREEIHIHRRRVTRREPQKVTVRKEAIEIIRSGQSS